MTKKKTSGYFFSILCLVFICVSCKEYPYPPEVTKVLVQAGGNRDELIKVLEHYQGKDSLKYKAACFLIENMIYHQSGEQYSIDPSYFDYFSHADSLLQESPDAINNEALKQNLATVFSKLPSPDRANSKPDMKVLSADYLIQNIDKSFDLWKHSPLLKNVSFDDFKEWILPYRTYNEALTENKEQLHAFFYKLLSTDGMEDIRKPIEIFKRRTELQQKINSQVENKYHLGVFDLYLRSLSGMECNNLGVYTCNIFRSCGIPIVFEFTPQWPAENCGHFWCASPDSSGMLQPYTPPYNNLREDWELSIKNAGKIFRITYAASPDAPYFIRNKSEKNPGFVNNPCLIDVTDRYRLCDDLKLHLPQIDNNLAYLCFFNRGQLNPVAWGKVDHNSQTVTYRKVPLNILFFAAYIKDDNLQIVGNPFILCKDSATGKTVKKEYACDGKKKVSLHLLRKYPSKPYLRYYRKNIEKACLVGYNKAGENEKGDTLLRLSDSPISPYWQEYRVKNTKKYRYYRFRTKPGTSINIAEFEFLGKKSPSYEYSTPSALPVLSYNMFQELSRDMDLVKIKGTPIRDTDPLYLKAYDGDPETYVESFSLGMDFGIPVCISHIRFLPRNAMNIIEPDCNYQLLYYKDGTWIELSSQKSKYNYVDFDQVPAGTIYWLRNLDKGKEELPFVYQGRKQVFINELAD